MRISVNLNADLVAAGVGLDHDLLQASETTVPQEHPQALLFAFGEVAIGMHLDDRVGLADAEVVERTGEGTQV